MLDTNVLGYLCHPRLYGECKLWMRGVLGMQLHEVLVPEVADYELRRKLLHQQSQGSLNVLNRLGQDAVYVPINTATMRAAAGLWARLRATGQPTEDAKELGVDVILAAQAILTGATVVTDNVKHLTRMVDTVRWEDVR